MVQCAVTDALHDKHARCELLHLNKNLQDEVSILVKSFASELKGFFD
jgi:hypothetical protein